MDISKVNEVYEQAVYELEGTTFEVLQLMGDVNVDDYLDEVSTIKELQASLPVIGQYQYIKVEFSRGLTLAVVQWDTDATDLVSVEDWVQFIPSTEEQVQQLTVEQLYTLVATNFVDMYSYTSFENPNVLEGHVEIQEG